MCVAEQLYEYMACMIMNYSGICLDYTCVWLASAAVGVTVPVQSARPDLDNDVSRFNVLHQATF